MSRAADTPSQAADRNMSFWVYENGVLSLIGIKILVCSKRSFWVCTSNFGREGARQPFIDLGAGWHLVESKGLEYWCFGFIIQILAVSELPHAGFSTPRGRPPAFHQSRRQLDPYA